MRGPLKHAKSATRSLKRSSAAAAARAAASDSEVAGEGGSEKASEASSEAEMTCEEWYHSLAVSADVQVHAGKTRRKRGVKHTRET